MSLWSTIAGIGAGIGGFVAAPFTGGASIPAGLALGGALISSGSVSDAAQKQADATSQALALQKTMYDTTRGDLAPYTQTGVGALGNLRQLAGVTMPASASTASTGMASTGAPNMVGQRPAPPNTPIIGTAVPRAQNGSGFVMMVGPDGSTNQVDPAHVAYYQNLGAKIINGSSYASPSAAER